MSGHALLTEWSAVKWAALDRLRTVDATRVGRLYPGRGTSFGRMRPRRERLPEALANVTPADHPDPPRADHTEDVGTTAAREFILAAGSSSTAGRLSFAIAERHLGRLMYDGADRDGKNGNPG